jgi:hypothetical protein
MTTMKLNRVGPIRPPHDDGEQHGEGHDHLGKAHQQVVDPASVVAGVDTDDRRDRDATVPPSTDVRAPNNNRASTSQPAESVPSKCFALGGARS